MIAEKTFLMMLNDLFGKKEICLSNNFRICFGGSAIGATVGQIQLPFACHPILAIRH